MATFKKLYEELSAPDETGEPADRDLFRVRKVTVFYLDMHVFNLLLKFNAYNMYKLCIIIQNRFERYFGGPYLELGHLLYKHLLGHVTGSVDKETFVATASRLERACIGRGHPQGAESLMFSVFSEGKDNLDEKGRSAGSDHISCIFSNILQ